MRNILRAVAIGLVSLCAASALRGQVTVRNGVSLANTSGSPAYNAGSTYAKGDVVTSASSVYVSLIGSNIGNTPAISPSDWQPLSSGATTPATVMIVVAASNSINKASANFIATGTGDQATINAAIAACPATLPASAGPGQCKIVLQPGVYDIASSIIVDTDHITLSGESHCMWGGYNNHPWTGTSTPNGAIGTGCAQLKASATGFPIIEIAHAHTAGTGADTQRHRGIEFSQLYLVGDNYGNSGIATIGNGTTCNTSVTFGGVTVVGCLDDNVRIIDNVIQRTNLGIGVSLDSPVLRDNSIQDNNGPAEAVCGVFARVSSELLFDNAGTHIIACSSGATYQNSILGDTQGDGIHFYVSNASATGNTLSGIVGSAYYVDGVSNISISGGVVDYTSDIFGYNTNGQLPTSADAIHITASSTGVSIGGGIGFNSGVNETGYAINDLGSGGSIGSYSVTGTWRFGVGAPFVNIAAGNRLGANVTASSPVTATPGSDGSINLQCPTCATGSSFTFRPPYLYDGAHYYVPSDGYICTIPPSSPTWLNSAAPGTVAVGTYGNVALTASAATTYWASQTATTSVEGVMRGMSLQLSTGAQASEIGIWIYDSTNNKIYSIANSVQSLASTGAFATQITPQIWTYSGSGLPSFSSNIQINGAQLYGFGDYVHYRLLKSGTSLLFQQSIDGGSTFFTIFTQTGVGTISKGGYFIGMAGTATLYDDVISVAVN